MEWSPRKTCNPREPLQESVKIACDTCGAWNLTTQAQRQQPKHATLATATASLWQTPICQEPNVHVGRRPLNAVNKLNHFNTTLAQNFTRLRFPQLKITRPVR